MNKILYLSLILGSFSGVFASQQVEPFKFSDFDTKIYTHIHIKDVKALIDTAIRATFLEGANQIPYHTVEAIRTNVLNNHIANHKINAYVRYSGGFDYSNYHCSAKKVEFDCVLQEMGRLNRDKKLIALMIPIVGIAGLVTGHVMNSKITVKTPITTHNGSVNIGPSWSTFALGVLAGAASVATGMFLTK